MIWFILLVVILFMPELILGLFFFCVMGFVALLAFIASLFGKKLEINVGDYIKTKSPKDHRETEKDEPKH